ncbi:MAG: DUF805 domain-containing protein [Alphaproteobacteria bacterium]|nr:DUF805 domain-containing protein [Alphaproteobacteria bacterium]
MAPGQRTLFHLVKLGVDRTFTYEGRIARLEYGALLVCWFAIPLILGSISAEITDWYQGKGASLGPMIVPVVVTALVARGVGFFSGLLAIFGSASASMQRVHDLGWSGWWAFLLLIPGIGSLFPLLLLLRRGESGPNNFGEPPTKNFWADS